MMGWMVKERGGMVYGMDEWLSYCIDNGAMIAQGWLVGRCSGMDRPQLIIL